MERSEIIREIVEIKKEHVKQIGIAEKINYLFFSIHNSLPFLDISEFEYSPEIWNKEVKQLIESELGEKFLIKSVVKSDGIAFQKNSNTYVKLCIELDYCKFEFFKLQYYDYTNWSPWKYKFFIIFHNGVEVCSFNGKKNDKFSHPSSTEVFDPKSFLSCDWLQDFDRLITSIAEYEKDAKFQKRQRLERKESEAAEDLRVSFSISENEIEQFSNRRQEYQSQIPKPIQVLKKLFNLLHMKF